jgi:hypothetical protein
MNQSTLAGKELFDIKNEEFPLEDKENENFHAMVAKLLYLAKSVRPDIILAVSFLCTKVKEPNMQDKCKLLHVLGYLQRKLFLRATKIMKVEACIDASFAAHVDGKLHMGVMIVIGRVLVFSPHESRYVSLRAQQKWNKWHCLTMLDLFLQLEQNIVARMSHV